MHLPLVRMRHFCASVSPQGKIAQHPQFPPLFASGGADNPFTVPIAQCLQAFGS